MKHVLITSILALGVSCGAAIAQTQPQPSQPSSANCAPGTADCQKGGKIGEQAQGKAGAKINEQAQGKAKVRSNEQAQSKTDANCMAGTSDCKKGSNMGKQGKVDTKTDAQAQAETKVQSNEQAPGKAGGTTDQQAQGKTDSNCVAGTSDCKIGSNMGKQARGKAGATDQQAQGKPKGQTDQQAQGKSQTQDKTATASINNVTVQQKTEITQAIKETKVAPVANVDFKISVGVEVPRDKIRLHRLPARIVKIVPDYESYEYFVLADGRIVIVDPDSLRIVLILS